MFIVQSLLGAPEIAILTIPKIWIRNIQILFQGAASQRFVRATNSLDLYSLTQVQRIGRAKIERTNFCETGPRSSVYTGQNC